MAANIPDISSLGFLFNGEHEDFSQWWYSEFATKFQQVAFIHAFSLPFSMASKVIVFELKRRVLAGTADPEAARRAVQAPPYLMSERYGMFMSAVLYTLLFSAGMPLPYFIMISMCGMLTVFDRSCCCGSARAAEVHRQARRDPVTPSRWASSSTCSSPCTCTESGICPRTLTWAARF